MLENGGGGSKFILFTTISLHGFSFLIFGKGVLFLNILNLKIWKFEYLEKVKNIRAY
jgi:hypothetical protein